MDLTFGHWSDMARTNKSWQMGFNEEQGFGPSENTRGAFPFPESGCGELSIVDASEQNHQLIFNNSDGKWYDISTRDGQGMTKIWTDGASTSGTGGTAVVPVVTFGEDRGTYEHYFLQHKESHIYVRPISESVGLPGSLQLDLDIFANGEPTTPTASSDDIPTSGDIKYDTEVEAHRIQTKLTANMGNHRIVGRQQYYVSKDQTSAPDSKVMNEDNLQRELSQVGLWTSIINGILTNRATGNTITGTYAVVSSPDARTDGISFSVAITLPSVTLVGGTLMVFYKGTIAVTVGGNAVALTTHDTTSDSWILGYATVTESGAVVITPTGTGYLFDLRTFATALSASARAYYFNNVDDYNGSIVLPR